MNWLQPKSRRGLQKVIHGLGKSLAMQTLRSGSILLFELEKKLRNDLLVRHVREAGHFRLADKRMEGKTKQSKTNERTKKNLVKSCKARELRS